MEKAFELRLAIAPKSKPRMTRGDKWRPRDIVKSYWAWKDEVLLKSGSFQLPDRFEIVFHMPMPRSWSKKKRREMCGKPHQLAKKNDLDNLLKAIMDAYKTDDGMVWQVWASKFWAEDGEIVIRSLP